MKYIDAERLIDKILQLQKKYAQTKVKEDDKAMRAVLGGQCYTLTKVVKIIESLQNEQPEVDLEKELDQWRHEHFAGERDGHYSGEYLERSSQLDIARHFYNLGRNARKEE